MNAKRCLLLSANPYSYVSKATGVLKQGIPIWYLVGDSLTPTATDRVLGKEPSTSNLDYSQLDSIKNVPGIYDIEFDIGVDKDNKPVLMPVWVSYVSDVEAVPAKPPKTTT